MILGKSGESLLDLDMPIPEPTGHLFAPDSVVQDTCEDVPKQTEAFQLTHKHYIGEHSEASMSQNKPYTDCQCDRTGYKVCANTDNNELESQLNQDRCKTRETSTETLKGAEVSSQPANLISGGSVLRNRTSQKTGKNSAKGYRVSNNRLSVHVSDANKESTGMSSCESETDITLDTPTSKKVLYTCTVLFIYVVIQHAKTRLFLLNWDFALLYCSTRGCLYLLFDILLMFLGHTNPKLCV